MSITSQDDFQSSEYIAMEVISEAHQYNAPIESTLRLLSQRGYIVDIYFTATTGKLIELTGQLDYCPGKATFVSRDRRTKYDISTSQLISCKGTDGVAPTADIFEFKPRGHIFPNRLVGQNITKIAIRRTVVEH